MRVSITVRTGLIAFALLSSLGSRPSVAAPSNPEQANERQASSERPNIVFFLIDDLGRTDVGFMGCKDIQTPHIDELAHGGVILDAHYVQPVCSPTRAALMTGRYATRTGVYTIVRPHSRWGLPLTERTLADALRQAGYETAITGKWHLGEFDRLMSRRREASTISMVITSERSTTSRTCAMDHTTGITTERNSTRRDTART